MGELALFILMIFILFGKSSTAGQSYDFHKTTICRKCYKGDLDKRATRCPYCQSESPHEIN